MSCSINERILKIIEYFHGNSVENFAEYMNIPEPQIKKLLQVNKKTKRYPRPSYKILITILRSYPALYSNWFLWGKGEMLLKEMFDKLCTPLEKNFYSQLEARSQEIQSLLIENGRLNEELRLYKTKE